ncbi:MAG: MFS transporter, partial [Chloroflexi bacterium]|nr:MFS transporter [Chloroflexota bacterium]
MTEGQPSEEQALSLIDLIRSPLLLAVYMPSMLFFTSNGLLIPVLPLFANDFDVSYAWVGAVLAAEGIGRLTGNVPAGILLGKLGRKTSMALGLAGLTLSTLLLVVSNSITMVLALRYVAGLSAALFGIAMHLYVT